MTRRTGLVAALAVVGAIAVGFFAMIGAAGAGKNDSKSKRMNSYLEVPSVSSPDARGSIEVRIRNSGTVDYKLTYSRLTTGAAAPLAAHIHFAQTSVNGGIAAFLCGGGTKPACPAPGSATATAMVEGTIEPTDLNPLGQTTAQGLLVNEMAEFIAAIRAGATYANVHTPTFTTGEIRGQIKARGGDDDDD